MFGKLFRRGRKAPPPSPSESVLGRILLRLSERDVWTVRDACANTLILGIVGSGKTTGSGENLLCAVLASDAFGGGLVLTVKPDEYERIRALSGDDVVRFGVGAGLCFNALDYESRQPGASVEDLAYLFQQLSEVAGRQGGGKGVEDAKFWASAAEQLCKNAITCVWYATGSVSFPAVYQFVSTLPSTVQESRSAEWRKSFAGQVLAQATEKEFPPEKARDLEFAVDYCLNFWPRQSDKMRSSIVAWFQQPIDKLLRSPFYDLLCGESGITPDDILERGKRIVVDLPVLVYGAVGKLVNCIWKFCLQRAAQRRLVKPDTKAVFLFADEFQWIASSHDALALSTSRSARLCHFLLTQSLSGLINAFGENGRMMASALTACCATRFYHASNDLETMQNLAETIGKVRHLYGNASVSEQQRDEFDWFEPQTNLSTGFSEQMDYELSPQSMSRLRTGGPENGFIVEAILYQAGKILSNGRMWMKVAFQQRI